MMAGRNGETAVQVEQRHVQRFGEGDVDGVIGCEVVPQIPDSGQKETVGIAVQRKVGEKSESCTAMVVVDLATDCVAADRVRDFDVEQMRGVQRQFCVK